MIFNEENIASSALKVKIKFFRDAGGLYGEGVPAAATAQSAGFDLRADIDDEVIVRPGERYMFNTGIAVEPSCSSVAGFVYSRSGLGAVSGLTVAQGVGLIDPDYRGEIKVALLNTGIRAQTVARGDRIAQLVFQPFFRAAFVPVDELGDTERGGGGFGHTGR